MENEITISGHNGHSEYRMPHYEFLLVAQMVMGAIEQTIKDHTLFVEGEAAMVCNAFLSMRNISTFYQDDLTDTVFSDTLSFFQDNDLILSSAINTDDIPSYMLVLTEREVVGYP